MDLREFLSPTICQVLVSNFLANMAQHLSWPPCVVAVAFVYHQIDSRQGGITSVPIDVLLVENGIEKMLFVDYG